MGMPKLALPFGDETMLARIVRLLGQVVQPIVVVAAPGQELPPIATDGVAKLIVARDRREGRGPLEGILAGLTALPDDVEAAYATSCDVPFLVPAFVERMFALLGEASIAVPTSGGYRHPLAAVYRRDVIPQVEQLLAADRMRPVFLFDSVPTRQVEAHELADVDPELETLKNLNHPSDYLAALAQAGFDAPLDVLENLSRDAGDD